VCRFGPCFSSEPRQRPQLDKFVAEPFACGISILGFAFARCCGTLPHTGYRADGLLSGPTLTKQKDTTAFVLVDTFGGFRKLRLASSPNTFSTTKPRCPLTPSFPSLCAGLRPGRSRCPWRALLPAKEGRRLVHPSLSQAGIKQTRAGATCKAFALPAEVSCHSFCDVGAGALRHKSC